MVCGVMSCYLKPYNEIIIIQLSHGNFNDDDIMINSTTMIIIITKFIVIMISHVLIINCN